MERPPARLADVIDGMLPPAPGGADVTAIVRAWPLTVGPAIAAETWPARLSRQGELLVHCSSSTWASELTLLAPGIAAKLAAALGRRAPEALRFRVGTLPQRTTIRTPVAPAAPSPRQRAAAAELAAPIADDDLRQAAERAIGGALGRADKA